MKRLFLMIPFFFSAFLQAKLPDLTPQVVTTKLNEIMKAHASYKDLNSTLVKRTLNNYIEELDPNKLYFIEPEIAQWKEPSEATVQKILSDFKANKFTAFIEIHEVMVEAIKKRGEVEKKIDMQNLPHRVNPTEFKDMKWTKDRGELQERLTRIKALQVDTVAKLNEEMREKSLQRIAKRQAKYEEDILNKDPKQRLQLILSNVLKATASSLDAHTAYFTPDEAAQFIINVQQRLFGIGAQLRDDLNGFSVMKIIEGGPAAKGKELKVKDRIVAIDGEPVVGMDIVPAVELIRGEENTPVRVTVIREVPDGRDNLKEEKLDINIVRGEVVLKETRYESNYEPFGDGVIGYLRLYSFYQDQDSSSAKDLAKEIKKLKEGHKVKGIVLDLRYNSGGMLSQAVEVTGLFITKGIVVSIKDDTGNVQHLRELDGKTAWDGPLVVLINRASASASEIVAQTLQDYGRGLVVGDDHSYGKGSFQTFTLSSAKGGTVNPQGEYKVTRGRYYTVSGKSPQLHGVISDIVVPGPLSELDIGEQYAKYPLEGDQIKENFKDDLSDIPFFQRDKVRLLYKFDLQPQLDIYKKHIPALKANSEQRIANNRNYQNLFRELKKKNFDEDEDSELYGQNDLQLYESLNVVKDLILFMQ
jgi:carboxyl-terminal processing protease